MSDIPPPKCKAILICDRAIVDEATGEISLIGIFNALRVEGVPTLLHRFHLFVQLTDGIGTYAVYAELHDLEEETVLARSPTIMIQWLDRLAIAEMVIEMPPIRLTRYGSFDLIVLADGAEIDRQRLTVQPPEGERHNE